MDHSTGLKEGIFNSHTFKKEVKNMRKSFWIVVVLIAVFALFSIAETINLTMDVGDSTAGRLLQNSVNIYEQTHPNVKIDVVVLPYYGGFMQKLALSIAGGTEPDLVQITTAYIPQTAPYMIDIASYIQQNLKMSPEEYKNTVIPSMRVFLGNGEQVLAIPLESTVQALWINKTMWDKAGILPPPLNGENTPWTFDEFVNALKKVKAANHTPAALSFDYSADRLFGFLSEYGITYLNDDGQYVLDQYSNAPQVIGKFINLFKEGIIPSAEWLSGQSPETDFFGHITTAYWAGSWISSDVLKQEKEVGGDYVPVYLPKGDKYWFGVPGGSFLGAFKTGNKQKEEAAINFMLWMANKNDGYLTYIVPGLDLSAYIGQKIDYGIAKMNEWQNVFEPLLGNAPAWTMTTRASAIYSQMYPNIIKQVSLGIMGQVTPDQIIKNLGDIYNTLNK